LAVKIPSSKLNTHGRLSFPSASTAIENRVHFRHIRFVIDNGAINFYPGMRFERELLYADDQLARNSVTLEQASRGCRPLKASHLFAVPDACQVDSRAKAPHDVRSRDSKLKRMFANSVADSREVSTLEVKIEADQLNVCLEQERSHDANAPLDA
jgi:hypothetical protein